MGFGVMVPKEKQKYLNQVLNFVNEDLESLPLYEKVVWAARFYLRDDVKRKSPAALVVFYEEKIKYLSDLQDALGGHINNLITAKGGAVFPMIPLRRYLRTGEDYYSVQYEFPTHEDLVEYVKDDTDNLLVMLQFDDALDGLPRNAIKKCPECGNFFAHLSKKEKDYCSPKCGYKFLSRKRRNELKRNPKKYKAFLKKQRESMHKVYIERKKKELGSNVVVQRNGKED